MVRACRRRMKEPNERRAAHAAGPRDKEWREHERVCRKQRVKPVFSRPVPFRPRQVFNPSEGLEGRKEEQERLSWEGRRRGRGLHEDGKSMRLSFKMARACVSLGLRQDGACPFLPI